MLCGARGVLRELGCVRTRALLVCGQRTNSKHRVDEQRMGQHEEKQATETATLSGRLSGGRVTAGTTAAPQRGTVAAAARPSR